MVTATPNALSKSSFSFTVFPASVSSPCSGTLAVTGQLATIRAARSRPPLIYVWDVETLEVLRTVDGATTTAKLSRSVAGLCFSVDSRLLLAVGADDKHTVQPAEGGGGREEGRWSVLWNVYVSVSCPLFYLFFVCQPIDFLFPSCR
jgi:WD40 repeat protein